MAKCKYDDKGFWHLANTERETLRSFLSDRNNLVRILETYGEYAGELPDNFSFAKVDVINSELIEALYA